MASITRLITGADVSVARNLKNTYLRKKGELNLTQVKLQKKLDMKQSTISQYMNGKIALNTEAVLKFAKVLRVHPGEIDPRVGRLVNDLVSFEEDKKEISILGTTSGKIPEMGESITRRTAGSGHLFAVKVDTTAYSPVIPKGSVVVIDPMRMIDKAGIVAVRRKNRESYEFHRLHEIDEDQGVFILSVVADEEGSEIYEIEMEKVSKVFAVRESRYVD
ncbi:helix-turn-helix domain-containing protein [Parendozoicomonas haliclonae]|uniref:Helix-turn-helix protein n=1 Tax=Parendozoicomonas haliclonae TaxID=1960125 RepID=A0A1X7AF02_9GAMM|nr:helix-turn-helix domain-containing protein [Parendozoicomonas haliclonae]SMA33656.1 helix-turn-helix protein [Parendozoicomonas haliclonae]